MEHSRVSGDTIAWPTAAECRCWRLGDGPSIRLVEAAEDGSRSLVWEVDSLGRAADWLRRQGWLGEEHEYRVAIAPEPLQGFEVWLTAAANRGPYGRACWPEAARLKAAVNRSIRRFGSPLVTFREGAGGAPQVIGNAPLRSCPKLVGGAARIPRPRARPSVRCDGYHPRSARLLDRPGCDRRDAVAVRRRAELWSQQRVPSPEPATAESTSFSAERAMHVEALAMETRFAGSPNHARTQRYIEVELVPWGCGRSFSRPRW